MGDRGDAGKAGEIFEGSGNLATANASWDGHRNRCRMRVVRGRRKGREDAEASGDLSTAKVGRENSFGRVQSVCYLATG